MAQALVDIDAACASTLQSAILCVAIDESSAAFATREAIGAQALVYSGRDIKVAARRLNTSAAILTRVACTFIDIFCTICPSPSRETPTCVRIESKILTKRVSLMEAETTGVIGTR